MTAFTAHDCFKVTLLFFNFIILLCYKHMQLNFLQLFIVTKLKRAK